MPGMPRRALLTSVVIALLAAVTACSGDTRPAGDLPDGSELIRASGQAMRSVKTARFEIAADGSIGSIPLRKANGVITSDGDAEGTAQIDQAGPVAELSFVVKGQTLHVKAVTGGWQQVPLAMASSVYDPSKILDPDQGVANVLATATAAKTEGRESIAGSETYRVAATFSGAALGRLVPGVTGDVPGQAWIDTERSVFHQGKFQVSDGTGKDPVTVTVTFSDFDVPVTIDEP